jgi:hypothetical protein
MAGETMNPLLENMQDMNNLPIPQWQKLVYALAKSKGWYDDVDLNAHEEMAELAVHASSKLASVTEEIRTASSILPSQFLVRCYSVKQLTPEQHVKIARLWLIASEVFEAVECVVNGQDWPDRYERKSTADENGKFKLAEKPEGLGIELADVAIRLLDFCEAYQIPLDRYMTAKHTYNESRPQRHGGKKV